MTVGALFILILPVFALIAAGWALSRFRVIEAQAEESLIRVCVHVLMPCMAFDTIIGNEAFRDPRNLVMPPVAGFLTTALGYGVAYLAARLSGFKVGQGLRTFAFSAGIGNYRYLPLPIIAGLWGGGTQGVLFVYTTGVEIALWSVGMLVLTGASPRSGWRRLLTPMLITLVVATVIDVAGFSGAVPSLLRNMAHSLGICAVPLGLIMTGANLFGHLGSPGRVFDVRTSAAACLVRLAVLPALSIAALPWIPCTAEVKRVVVVEAAMPAGVIPIIISQYYGGRPLTAVQVALSTTAAGIFLGPLWIRAGLAWAGIA